MSMHIRTNCLKSGHSVLVLIVLHRVYKKGIRTVTPIKLQKDSLTMRSLIVLFAVLAVVTARKYSSKHDNINIDRLVKSPRYMKMSVGCYLDRNNCNKMTATLKRAIPEIVKLACEKCTPTQKYILRRYLAELKKQLPEDYSAFRQKYDPKNDHFDRLEAAIQ